MLKYSRLHTIRELNKKKCIAQHEQKKLEPLSNTRLESLLDINLKYVKEVLGKSSDLISRTFHIGADSSIVAAIVYLDGMINNEVIQKTILEPLMLGSRLSDPSDVTTPVQFKEYVMQYALPVGEIREATTLKDIVQAILAGDTAFFIEGSEGGLLLNTKGWKARGVEEPLAESVVRGPRDGFTETLRMNTATIRRRLKDPDLVLKSFKIGARTNTDVAIMYLDGVADMDVVREVETRVGRIDIDGVMESGFIEQFIEDSHWSPFPQIQSTERPDKATANLLEGRVLILVDGTPFVLIVPAVFSQFYQSPEDYYERVLIGTLIRFIRFLSLFIALLLPSLYIAFSSFHPEMIPSKLVIAMAAGRATVPVPAVIEALMMEISIEILREASVRLPGPIGPTIGIVGALIVGEAAVKAGIVSPIMVIVVALTTIGSFATPSYSAAIAIRMLRFPIMIMAAILGLYGIMLALILVVIHLSSLKSFGVPYLSPLTPRNMLALGDTVIRIPLYRMKERLNVFAQKNQRKRLTPETAEGVTDHDKQES